MSQPRKHVHALLAILQANSSFKLLASHCIRASRILYPTCSSYLNSIPRHCLALAERGHPSILGRTPCRSSMPQSRKVRLISTCNVSAQRDVHFRTYDGLRLDIYHVRNIRCQALSSSAGLGSCVRQSGLLSDSSIRYVPQLVPHISRHYQVVRHSHPKSEGRLSLKQ